MHTKQVKGQGMDIGIVGGSGYGGAELLRLLAGHPTFRVRTVAAASTAGRTLADVFPHLVGSPQAQTVLAPADPEALAGCDLVLLATPHEASMALAPALMEQGSAVVDLSGAFRLPAEDFERWYALDHTAPALAPAPYGLPELFRPTLHGARLVASPGCYPTAALLALAPLAGLVHPEGVAVAGLSGTSGAGKGLREDLHVTHAMANAGAYAAPAHRHTPEIGAAWSSILGMEAAVTFVPHLLPMARGLLCTVTARLADDADGDAVRAAYRKAYDAETFVTLLSDGSWPQTAYVRGGNGAHVGVSVDERTRTVVASCAIDNLVKGAAGQAIQNANILLAQPEDAGLSPAGAYP